jgi:hypothetical protein
MRYSSPGTVMSAHCRARRRRPDGNGWMATARCDRSLMRYSSPGTVMSAHCRARWQRPGNDRSLMRYSPDEVL